MGPSRQHLVFKMLCIDNFTFRLDRFWRKLQEQNIVSPDPSTSPPPSTEPTLPTLPTPPPPSPPSSTSSTSSTSPTANRRRPSELEMADLMDQLYKAEVEKKPLGPVDQVQRKVGQSLHLKMWNSNPGPVEPLSNSFSVVIACR